MGLDLVPVWQDVFDEDGRPIWPTIKLEDGTREPWFDDAWVTEKQTSQGAYFEPQYRMSYERLAATGKVFRYEWIKHYPTGEPMPPIDFYAGGVDLAASPSSGANFWAMCMVGVDYKKDFHVLESVRKHLTGPDEGHKIILDAQRGYGPRAWRVEANGFQLYYVQELIQHYGLMARPVTHTTGKLRRGLDVATLVELGRVWFHRGSDDLIGELLDFDGGPRGQDDLFDAFEMAMMEALVQLGLIEDVKVSEELESDTEPDYGGVMKEFEEAGEPGEW